MVLMKNKILMVKSDDIVVLQLTKETIEESIVLTESKQYDGRLYEKDIKFHLIHLKTEKTDCKKIAN